ncbi:hypothetical protein GCM10028805_27310 [Spirosoma harenae]
MLVPHPAKEFLSQFLTKRHRNPSFDTPLYSYKTSREEYKALKTLLIQASPTDTSLSISACFVLFAAEWWRRNYSGGHWEWEPIFSEIRHTSWNNTNTRQLLTTNGLQYWKRSVFQRANGDRAYLGTVFVEAGLPIGVLLNPSSHIRELVVRAFDQQQTYFSDDYLLLVREAAQSLNLPATLQNDAFYELIGQVVSGLLSLKKEYGLALQSDPLSYLQQHVPNWQDRLPLWLDHDAKAGTFLGELLVETVRTPRREPTKITIKYRLKQTREIWYVQSTLCIPDGHYRADDLSIMQDDFASLPDKVAIKLVTAKTEHRLDYAFKNGNELSVRGLTQVIIPDDIATEPWQLVLTNTYNEIITTIPIPYCDGLPTDLPWVFIENEVGDWLLAGIGSIRIRSSQARVVCSASLNWRDTEKPRMYIGDLTNELVIYDIHSSAHLHDLNDGQTFQIRLAENADDTYVYMLLPQSGASQIKYFPRLHPHLYLGFPRLFRVHTLSGIRSLVSLNRIEYKIGSTWRDLTRAEFQYGRYKIRTIDSEGALVYSQEISVLPSDFAIHIDQKNPSIVLFQSERFALSVYIGKTDLSAQISREGNGHRVTLLRDNDRERIRLRLSSPTTQAIDIYVPFPATSGYFIDKYSAQSPRENRLSVNEIYGNGLVVNNLDSREKTHDIVFTLDGCHKPPSLAEIRREIRLKPFSSEIIPLIRFQDDIRRLLSYADSVDAKVRVSVPTFPVSPRLWLTQHTCNTNFDQSTRTISLKGDSPINQLPILQAFRLDESFKPEKLIRLEALAEGWSFPALCQGKWFYFAAPDSSIQIRPKVAVLENSEIGDCTTVTAIWEAANLSYQNRQEVLRKLFDSIASDFSDANWVELDALYTITKHLSLQALDAWKALMMSDGGLVCFFLRSTPDRLERFTDEFSICWYRISIVTWQQGIAAYRQYLDGLNLPSREIVNDAIEQKLTELDKGFKLKSLAQILRRINLSQSSDSNDNFQVYSQTKTVQWLLSSALIGQEKEAGLIGRHINQKFPTDLAEELRSCVLQLPITVRQLLPDLKAQPYTRPLVYLPVVLAYHSVCPQHIDIRQLSPHLVTKLIDFDAEHFYFFFNLIQSFCWLTLAS